MTRERYATPNRVRKATLTALAAVAGLATIAGCGSSQTHAQAPRPNAASTAAPNKIPSSSPSHSGLGIGYDVSYIQCGLKLPTGQSFGVVGINGGYANNTNPCLAQEYAWAQHSAGTSSLSKAMLYMWAANPGNSYKGAAIKDWPHSGKNELGTCTGTDGAACSFQYGINKGNADVTYAKQQLGITHLGTIFIDVEATSSWQTDTANNVATIEGYITAIKDAGDTPGIYSDQVQFPPIAGNVTSGPLAAAEEWVTGGGTVQGAEEDCSAPFVSGARVVLSQFMQGPPPAVTVYPIRLDYACAA